MSNPNQARLATLPTTDPSPDDDLVRRVLDGEKMLYAVLMRRYNRRIYRAVRAIVGQDHEAEDVVQHAYVTAYDKLAQYRGDASFGAWLTRIAVNEALGRARRRKRGGRLALVESGGVPVMAKSTGNPEQEALRREIAGILEAQIDGLPESLRLVFTMRDVEQLNTAETAASLGLSEAAVRVRLHRARQLMQERLMAVMEAAPEAFQFDGERCDRIVLGVLDRLGL